MSVFLKDHSGSFVGDEVSMRWFRGEMMAAWARIGRIQRCPRGPLVHPYLPITHSDTNLGAAVKGSCRCYEGSKPAEKESIPGGPTLIR